MEYNIWLGKIHKFNLSANFMLILLFAILRNNSQQALMKHKHILIYNHIFDFFVLGSIRCRNYFYSLSPSIFAVRIFAEMLVLVLKTRLTEKLILKLMCMYSSSAVIVKLFCFMTLISSWAFVFCSEFFSFRSPLGT